MKLPRRLDMCLLVGPKADGKEFFTDGLAHHRLEVFATQRQSLLLHGFHPQMAAPAASWARICRRVSSVSRRE